MRLSTAITLILACASTDAFAPQNQKAWGTALRSTLEYDALVSAGPGVDVEAFKAKLAENKGKMAEKDKTSKALSKEDLKIIHEDEHIIVVDKPAGVLSVPGKEGNPSMQQAVFDAYGCESGNSGKMICHRLGMDTSGLMIFARTDHALRDLNAQFRTRKVTRQYEALVCGSVEGSGSIDLPLMMDYENPPYMTVSTEGKQRALIGLDSDDVGKRILENEKASLTEYEVVGTEEIAGSPVTRLSLTSVTGRTHQLNVHCAAIGHPIVGDKVYGIGGDAAPNGGVESIDGGASEDVQKAINGEASAMCVHAKSISFRHPGTRETVSFESAAPF